MSRGGIPLCSSTAVVFRGGFSRLCDGLVAVLAETSSVPATSARPIAREAVVFLTTARFAHGTAWHSSAFARLGRRMYTDGQKDGNKGTDGRVC